MSDDSELDALLDSVASGERVDWEIAEGRAAGPEQRARLRALRDVARLAEFNHTLQHDVAPAAAGSEIGRWGDLLLLERVGAGAGGEVYRAWDPALQREVALKLARTREDGAREASDWLEEARTLARVRDPHVVTVFGAAEHDGRAGLWMEFLHGPTLEAEIARRGPLAAGEVARLGAQLGLALRAAHASGTLHRDVKPANVVLEHAGRAVLTDFGLGQRSAAERDPGPFSGTPMFMSPQRLAGAAAKPTDDLYALGVTLHCALAGTPPFRADTLEGLRKAVAAGPDRPLRTARAGSPPALIAAIERAMAPEPEARFESAAGLIAAFEAAGDSPRAATGSSHRPRSGLLLAATFAVAATLAWLAVVRLDHRQPAETAVVAPTPPTNFYDVSASFIRRGPGGDTHLETGDRIGPGDRVRLEFHSTRPVWVYVLDADERGATYVLFPQPMFDRRNPLPRDSIIVLPGRREGHETAWTVTSRGGREHLLVVASPGPVAELEAELAQLPAPAPGRPVQYARIETRAVERLRGIGGVSEIPSSGSPQRPSPLFDRIRALAGGEQAVRGTWVRQVVLENPLR
jgi:serine/threonine protein kinase